MAGSGSLDLQWIPLTDAAVQYSLDEGLLKQLVKDGLVRFREREVELLVVAEDVELLSQRLGRKRFQHLRGKPIPASHAAKKYGISYWTLLKWSQKGHIKVLRDERPLLLDEADVAYAKALAEVRGLREGRRLFP